MKLGATLARAALATLLIILATQMVGPHALAAASVQAGVAAMPNPPVAESQACSSPNSGQGVAPSSLAIFDVVSCTMTLSGNAPGPVSDGTVVITLSSVAGQLPPAVLSCAAPCVVQAGGTQINAPCGATAPAGNVPSVTCTSIAYTIASQLAACLTTPLNACASRGSFSSTSGSEQVNFLATPGNGGASSFLSSDALSFTGPGVGTLLVAASPAAIPSNGTLGSVVTASFACSNPGLQGQPSQATSFNSVGGFPLANTAPFNPLGVLPNGTIGTGGPGCGAGLPGGFTFSAPRGVIFDNGRTVESIGCGLGANVSSFGGTTPFTPYRSTAPLAFTCTGAAVLAIGSGGLATTAPINVLYSSAVGGLTAVGSTLLTIVPSPIAQMSVTCTPPTITGGGPGTVCTASVTDPNGVPISGLTGATVDWTTSDTSRTIVEACQTDLTGPINVTTTPKVTLLLTTLTPCQLPAATFIGQNSTFVNGQASALVVSPAGSSPGSVTISAGLYTLIPPSVACELAPFISQPILPLTYGTGAPAVSGCGTANPVGLSGLASTLSTQTVGVTGVNTVGLPQATSAGTAITIVSSSYLSVAGVAPGMPLQLSKGCNQVTITSPIGTPLTSLAALVSPADTVISIWRFDNATKLYDAGYFADLTAPTDFVTSGYIRTTIAPSGSGTIKNSGAGITESYFICVQRSAMIQSQ